MIRRLLSEQAVRASNRWAQFAGAEAYEPAGGVITRDLFDEGNGGWLQDPALLDRRVDETLKAEASKLESEVWKWVAASAEFPYGRIASLRKLRGTAIQLSGRPTVCTQHAASSPEAGVALRTAEIAPAAQVHC